MNKVQRITGIGAIALLALAGGVQAAETPQGKVTVEIKAQPLDDALNAFGAQSGLQIVFMSEIGKGLKAPRLSGTLTPAEALTQLLANTGLKFQFINERTVSIRSAREGANSSGSAANQMRMADNSSSRTLASEASSEDQDSDKNQVTVKGDRENRPPPFSTANLDLTRTEDDVLPFTVLTAEDIRLSGAIDLREFLANRLPQNFTDNNATELRGDGRGALNDAIDLRGWGSGETVLLLNGRRMGTEYQGLNADTGDNLASLRGIPLASIERIEILTSAGSAIYGANATGGVINIITRQDFTGGQLSVSYQTPMDVMRARRSMSFNLGMPVKGFGLRLSGGYNDTSPMLVGDRADVSVERYRRLVLERDPAQLIVPVSGDSSRTSSYVYGATPNIRARTTTYATTAGSNGNPGNLFAGLPGSPRSNFTSSPAGYTGGGNLSQFRPGTYNLDLPDGTGSDYGRQSYVSSPGRNFTLRVGLDRSLGKHWNWSADYSYSENQSRGSTSTDLQFSSTGVTASRRLLPAAAPTNPFGQDVMVTLVDPNLDRPELQARPRNMTWLVSSTLRGQIGEWRGYLDVSLSQNRSRATSYSFHEPAGGWNAAFLSGAYNPLVDTRVVSPASAQFYEHYTAEELLYTNGTRNYRGALKASGPVFSLPAGGVQLTSGLEWMRINRYRSDFELQYRDSLSHALVTPLAGVGPTTLQDQFAFANARLSDFRTASAYAEVSVPLLGAPQGIPLVHSLELFASSRLDRMKNSGYVANNVVIVLPGQPPAPPPPEASYEKDSALSAIGLRYGMFEGLHLRFSVSAGFKPPSLVALTIADPPTRISGAVRDPVRGENNIRLQPAQYITGGNPDLRPESTRSTNVGIVLLPRRLSGFRLAVDYLESVRDDAIFALSTQDAITMESELPGRVQRGAPDGNASGVGPITFVDQRYINLRQVSSRSVDINLEQQFTEMAGGRVVMNVAATRNLSFKVQASNTGTADEQVRNATASIGRQIAWNGNAQLRWEGPELSIGWAARYYDYLLIDPAYLVLQGSDRAPAEFNHDLNFSLRLRDAGNVGGLREWFNGTAVTFGVKNVFDRKPRFWANSEQGIAPYDGSVLAGRVAWLQLNKDFQ